MKENVHQSIFHSNIYKSAQKNCKQPNQLKSNNIHIKREPHVRIMLLFKFFFFFLISHHFVSTIINWKQLELQLYRSYYSQQKNFAKRKANEAELYQQNQNPFGLEFRLETNHTIKNFRCLEFKSFYEYRQKKNRHPPRAPRSCSTSLSITTYYNCSIP